MRTVGLLLRLLVCSGGSGDVIGWDGWRDGGGMDGGGGGDDCLGLGWFGLMLMLIVGWWLGMYDCMCVCVCL